MVGPSLGDCRLVLAFELLLVSSPSLISELARVLAYPKLTTVFPDPVGVTERIRVLADTIEPAFTLTVLADEPDNRVLEAAVVARVDAVVTGDGGLLTLGTMTASRSCRQPDSLSGRSVTNGDGTAGSFARRPTCFTHRSRCGDPGPRWEPADATAPCAMA
ncbi:MAG: putative toxin-antitoxin system toxin component, PIN family [Actinomycetota bacterium]|nr:putative toxin-antitoxin system toxin component, PIN family [Actinomycetota bacterium]